jgi:hypothetical protein
MDAIIGVAGGLAGVLIGWWLAYRQQRQQQVRAGRFAALLVMAELQHNEGRLDEIQQLQMNVTDRPVRRQAWDTNGLALREVASDDDLLVLVTAYHLADSAEYTSKFLRDSVEQADNDLRALRVRREAAEEHGDRDQASQIAEDAHRIASENIPQLEEARDKFLADIGTETLPAVSDAKNRVARLTEID